MPTTTNFGWTTPADTDLVKDGASAIRTLANGIDTSFLDLKGGTTNQILKKNSNTDLDFVWAAPSSGALVLVGSTDFTTSTSVVVSSCFSSTYDFYVAYVDFSAATGNAGYNVRMRLSGTSASTNYNWNRDQWYGSTSAQAETTSGSSFFVGEVSASYANRCGSIISFIDPALARPTKIYSQARFVNVNQSVFGANIYGDHNTSTAYDSLEIFPDGGNVSGSVRVYAYAKS